MYLTKGYKMGFLPTGLFLLIFAYLIYDVCSEKIKFNKRKKNHNRGKTIEYY